MVDGCDSIASSAKLNATRGFIRRAKDDEILGSWDRGPQSHARLWPSIGPPRIGRPAIFARHFFKKRCSSLFAPELLINCESIKQFWRHILSYLQSHCILDSIRIGLRKDSLRIVARFDRFLPLNAERTPKRKQSNSLEST